MRNARKAIVIKLTFFMLFLAFSNQGQAQVSPLKIKKVTVTPSSFKPGDIVSVSVVIRNQSDKTYDCPAGGGYRYKVFVYIFKATPHSSANQVWSAYEYANILNWLPGETCTYNFSAKWTVPDINTDRLIFLVMAPVCYPDINGHQAEITFYSTCVYSQPQRHKIVHKIAPPPKLKD